MDGLDLPSLKINTSDMKKSILVFSTALTSFGLMAFGCMNVSTSTSIDESQTNTMVEYFNNLGPSLYMDQTGGQILYDVSPRFMGTVTKEELNEVTSMAYFLSNDLTESIVAYKSVSVIILDHNYNFIKTEKGDTELFNASQLKLLRSAPYSTDILIRADFQEKIEVTGELRDNYSTPHITVVPEKQAVYVSGKDALIAYVKKNTNKYLSEIRVDELKPGKVRFTISTEGKVDNVFLDSTSGYDPLDEEVLELIAKMPGTWEPAESAKGEKVEQELVFAFGTIGC